MRALATAAAKLGAAALFSTAPGLATALGIVASADTYIRTDLDVRRDDNYGMQGLLHVGTSRGGGGLPFGGADAERVLIRFNLGALTGPVAHAELQLTVGGPGYYPNLPSTTYTVDVHRILSAPPLTPWVEGNGFEGPNETATGGPPGSVFVNEAFGVAWAGAGDNPDPFAQNNTTQPPFDPVPAARALIIQGRDAPGTIIRWDLTTLVNAWFAGTPNEGIVLRDPTASGTFREVYLESREGIEPGYPHVPGPTLVITAVPEPTSILLLAAGLTAFGMHPRVRRRLGIGTPHGVGNHR